MSPEQLTLDVDAGGPTWGPGISYLSVMCPDCGPVACVPVEGANWNVAEKWAYLAHLDHQRAHAAVAAVA